MIAEYSVKIDGKWYMAGEEIPLPFSDEDITFDEKSEGKKYTKTEIMRMSKSELQELARNIGIEGADEMSGAQLKEHLISVFGL